jgi:hypothetical protein
MNLLQQKPKVDPKAEHKSSFDSAKMYVWLKALEGKVNNLIREMNLIKNDFVAKSKDMQETLKISSQEILELKHEQESSLKKMDIIIKELKQTAGIEKLQTLQKYVDFWNPINFVTQRDVERIVEQKMTESKKTKEKKAETRTLDSAQRG